MGKTTFLNEFFETDELISYDLLDSAIESRYIKEPHLLEETLLQLPRRKKHILIDEIQRVPQLLDVVHRLSLKAPHLKFALTGSSARKLKRGKANLLAGRAFVYHLYPLTEIELGDAFDLKSVLRWGSLPGLFRFTEDSDRIKFLQAYCQTYLREEIAAEQLVRNLNPFRLFLEIAAQVNATIVNFAKIAHDINVDTKTVQTYFEILEDTLVGTLLPAYHRSLRKRQRQNPKFYFFDMGVKAALDQTVMTGLTPGTYGYGMAFEQFVILEAMRLNQYFERGFQFSYLRTKDDAEIDLIIERPGARVAFVEIKSTTKVTDSDLSTLKLFLRDFPKAEGFCLSQDPIARKKDGIHLLKYQKGFKELGLSP